MGTSAAETSVRFAPDIHLGRHSAGPIAGAVEMGRWDGAVRPETCMVVITTAKMQTKRVSSFVWKGTQAAMRRLASIVYIGAAPKKDRIGVNRVT